MTLKLLIVTVLLLLCIKRMLVKFQMISGLTTVFIAFFFHHFLMLVLSPVPPPPPVSRYPHIPLLVTPLIMTLLILLPPMSTRHTFILCKTSSTHTTYKSPLTGLITTYSMLKTTHKQCYAL